MKEKTYRARLTAEEEQRLKDIVSKGVHPARQVRRARILLLLNEGTDREEKPVKAPEQSGIAEWGRCTTRLVYIVSKQYAGEGLERALNRKKRETPPVPAKVTGDAEAKIRLVQQLMRGNLTASYGSCNFAQNALHTEVCMRFWASFHKPNPRQSCLPLVIEQV
jgi:hypothetical protein